MRNEIANVFLIVVKTAIFVHAFLLLKFNWESFPYNKSHLCACVFQYAFAELSYCMQEMVCTPQSS